MSPADRSAPPRAERTPDLQFPAYQRRRLANGLECLLLPRHDLPLADIVLLVPAGGENNPAARPGLATVVAALLDEGSRKRSGIDLALDVESLGAALATGADWDSAHVEIGLLSKDLDKGLRTVAEVALEPVFPEPEVERIRRQVLTEIARRRDQPSLLAEQALAAAVYPRSPYGQLLQGTRDSLEALTRDELVAFHADRYIPAGTHLLLGGDFDPDRALRTVEEIFGGWSSGSAGPPQPSTSEATPPSRRIVVVDLPRAAQTELRIGHAGVPRTHPDRTRLGVLNALLGGKFTSRLNLNLRERHGYTYGAWSRFVDRRGPGPFLIGAAVANENAGAAVGEIFGELGRIRERPAEPVEVEDTRSYLIGVFPYTLQTTDGLLARLADLAVHGLADDHFQRSIEEIRNTTADELLELAQRHLRPDEMVVTAAGPAGVLAPQLSSYGKVEITSAP